jgi:glycosyltransferase involved in cell wall biosynthesis
MRVLHVDSELPWRGGQNQILLLMRRQRARGDDPQLVAPGRGALAARAAAEGFPVHPVGMRGTWDIPAAIALARVMHKIRPDVVHWHAARAHAVGAIAALLAPRPARVLSRRVQIPVRRSPGSRLLYALRIDRIAAISNAVRDALVQSGVDARKIDVVPSGIDPAPARDPSRRAEVRARLGCSEEEVVGINVSALAAGKAHLDLMQGAAIALRRAPRLRLWIAGEGPLENALRAERRALDLEREVQLLGFRADIMSLLQAADFFCLPTLHEGLGSSILEAMSAGLPVIATRVGGIPEIIEDGRNGILIPPSDPGALADAMVEMATRPDLRGAMGACGATRAGSFSADRTAEAMVEVYRLALAAGRRLTV